MVTVVEDESRSTVTIDGQIIDGFVDDKTCATCGTRRVYYHSFDAYFCAACNAWLEALCSDRSCSYCQNRPATPLPIRASTAEEPS